MELGKKAKELGLRFMAIEAELANRYETRGQFRSLRWMTCVIATIETVEYATAQHHGLPTIIACIACAIGSHLVLIHNETRLNSALVSKQKCIVLSQEIEKQ